MRGVAALIVIDDALARLEMELVMLNSCDVPSHPTAVSMHFLAASLETRLRPTR